MCPAWRGQGTTERWRRALSENPNAPRIDPEVVALFGQAWSLLTTSQLRYWSHTAETWAALLPQLVQQATAPANAENAAETRAALIDALRSGIGEMVQQQVTEARRVEAELTDLARRVWPGPADGAADGYTRRWTAKE